MIFLSGLQQDVKYLMCHSARRDWEGIAEGKRGHVGGRKRWREEREEKWKKKSWVRLAVCFLLDLPWVPTTTQHLNPWPVCLWKRLLQPYSSEITHPLPKWSNKACPSKYRNLVAAISQTKGLMRCSLPGMLPRACHKSSRLLRKWFCRTPCGMKTSMNPHAL